MNKEIHGEKCSERDSLSSKKTVLHVGASKKNKLSLSSLARRTFSSSSQLFSGRCRAFLDASEGNQQTKSGTDYNDKDAHVEAIIDRILATFVYSSGIYVYIQKDTNTRKW